MITHSYTKTLVTLKDVCQSYGDNVVLRDVNGSISEIVRDGSKGQVVGFLGPSGCGKTQLFRIIAGLQSPTSGMVSLNGNNIPVQAGEVGVVQQNYPLFNHRSVFGNLLKAAVKKEPNVKAATEKVEFYLNEFDLTNRKHYYPMSLSGGQRQRIAIIQQILCADHFLLMDEPFSGLDMVMLEKTCELIQKVANMDELNTVILISHDITTTASVSDHLWLLGHEKDEQGNSIPGTRVVEKYDLIERELCWEPGIITQPRFAEFVLEVKNRFRTL